MTRDIVPETPYFGAQGVVTANCTVLWTTPHGAIIGDDAGRLLVTTPERAAEPEFYRLIEGLNSEPMYIARTDMNNVEAEATGERVNLTPRIVLFKAPYAAYRVACGYLKTMSMWCLKGEPAPIDLDGRYLEYGGYENFVKQAAT